MWLPLVFIFILTRVYHFMVLPPFLDELLYVRWLNTIKTTGDWLLPLKEFGWEPLGIWTASLINRVIGDPLFSLRLNSVLFGLLSLVMVYKLAGKTAALLYLLSPLILFHDRLGLRGDNLVIFGALMVYYGLSKKLSVWWGLGIAIGLFSKTTAAALPIVVVFSYLWLRPKLKRKDFIAGILSITPVIFYWLTGTLSQVINKQSTFVGEALIKNNLLQIGPWLYQYLTWPVLLLVFIGFKVAWKNRLLWLSWLVPLLLLIVSAKILFPRYLLPLMPFLLIYAAAGFNWLKQKLPKLLRPLLIIFLLAPAWFCWQIMQNPVSAPLPEIDKWQYITGWPSGYGVKELIDYLQTNQLAPLLKYSAEEILTDKAKNGDYIITNINHEGVNGELVKEFFRPENKSSIKLFKLQ